MSWIEELINVYNELGGSARYKEVYELIVRRGNVNLTREWKASVRKTVEDHSSDSENFKSLDIFKKIGKGHWGLRDQEDIQNHINQTSENRTPTKMLEELYIGQNDYNDIEETTRKLREINQINRNKRIVNILKLHYDYKCQICNTHLDLHSQEKYIEVHHLKPLGAPHNGPDIIENMIVVCPNCHVLLDYKSIQISLESIKIKEPHIIDLQYLIYQNSILKSNYNPKS